MMLEIPSHLAAAIRDVIEGRAVVAPKVATFTMTCAAIDTDSVKLGDISPLGFRCSPQTMFERCWRAMLAASPYASPPVAARDGGGE